jgi:putative redox protein
MTVRISGKYLGNKKTEIKHEDSGVVITTSAPVDNQGDGLSFSPTDLFASSLGACMSTIAGIVAEQKGIDVAGMRFELIKHMSANPRQVSKIEIEMYLPDNLNESERILLQHAAMACPVHKSLSENIEVVVKFNYLKIT